MKTVASFIGPLLVGIGLLGTFLGWVVRRYSRAQDERTSAVRQEFSHFAELNNANLTALKEQLSFQKEQMASQARTLADQNVKLDAAATAIARIEGRLMGAQTAGPPP